MQPLPTWYWQRTSLVPKICHMPSLHLILQTVKSLWVVSCTLHTWYTLQGLFCNTESNGPKAKGMFVQMTPPRMDRQHCAMVFAFSTGRQTEWRGKPGILVPKAAAFLMIAMCWDPYAHLGIKAIAKRNRLPAIAWTLWVPKSHWVQDLLLMDSEDCYLWLSLSIFEYLHLLLQWIRVCKPAVQYQLWFGSWHNFSLNHIVVTQE